MNLLWLVVIILVVLAVVGAPGIGPISHGYGYYPSGLFTIIVIVLIVMLLR